MSALTKDNSVAEEIIATTVVAIATIPKSAGVRSRARIMVLTSVSKLARVRAAVSQIVPFTSFDRVLTNYDTVLRR